MTLHCILLTEAARHLKQIRQIAQDQGLVVLTSHDKPALIVVKVERGKQLLEGVQQLARLLAADNLLGFARAISAADERRLGFDADWIGQALADLQGDERAGQKTCITRCSPTQWARSLCSLTVLHGQNTHFESANAKTRVLRRSPPKMIWRTGDPQL